MRINLIETTINRFKNADSFYQRENIPGPRDNLSHIGVKIFVRRLLRRDLRVRRTG